MTYQEKLRQLRGETARAEIVSRSGLDLSTVIKAETENRPVKFKTVAAILHALGHADDSDVMREVALLWLESQSGVHFSSADAYSEFKKLLKRDRANLAEMLAMIGDACVQNGRSPTDLGLLCWAAQSDEALEILRNARSLDKRTTREPEEAAQLPRTADGIEKQAPRK